MEVVIHGIRTRWGAHLAVPVTTHRGLPGLLTGPDRTLEEVMFQPWVGEDIGETF